ncbi:MAG: M1 family aminopeptidase [Bacteroidota bacterium]
MNFRSSVILFLAILFGGCTGSKKMISLVSENPPVEIRNLDTLTVSASKSDPVYELPIYNPSAERTHDLLHTKLDVRFDWTKQYLLGKATLTLKPHFYATNRLVLDAKGFDIHKVQLVSKDGAKDLKYEYDDVKLNINLGAKHESDQKFDIFIDYTAKPNEREAGGSAAITSDKGLYFINPLGEDKDKPMQIWTQGQTEANSCWFPTIDKPNERCTQEISITIEDNFQTLSNGLLKSSVKNDDGTRTDTYALDLPHAPYLFMMSIGEYFVQQEQWRNVLLEYMVEHDYKESAKAIFSNTPEMLEFFTEKLGVDFPWPKYSQVVVRDYVSGAMENTTGVIYGEFVQKTNRELIDNHNERIVAHETIHQWFGNLVTCESWANLTMNEGFANYGEYLWFEHKYGRDAADYHLLTEMGGYLRQARRNMRNLIYFGYADKEDMFDAHSYNKGGMVLHMLRNSIGDDAFWASLNRYLVDNAFTAVEAHDLRLAVEEVIGVDMNWFFNQWFYESGHPVLEISKSYDTEKRQLTINVKQTQSAKKSIPIFQLPVNIDIYQGPRKMRKSIWIDQRKQSFTFEVATEPTWVSFDADRVLLAEISETGKTDEEFIEQFHRTSNFQDRFDAITHLTTVDSDAARATLKAALDDTYWVIRRLGLRGLESLDTEQVKKMALNDERSQVRVAALDVLAEMADPTHMDIAKKVIEKDQAYRSVAAGLSALYSMDPESGLEYAQKLEKEDNGNIILTIGAIYNETDDTQYLPFFENNWHKFSGFSGVNFIGSYTDLVKLADNEVVRESMNKLKAVSMDQKAAAFRRYATTKGISDIQKHFGKMAEEATETDEKTQYQSLSDDFKQMIQDIIAAEPNERLKRFYAAF